MEFGKVYKWCPESVVVECDCDEMLTLTRSETGCEWGGVDHAEVVREEPGRPAAGRRDCAPLALRGGHEES